ncbi:hypothetical protein Pan44_32520 [Caulifigura coniformis]|uniref:DUF58 domain-containing protein n=1 Tax=Caulifigura coniformis TaxID=2527983 RepID=A0A517SGH9_9PLAN|nr:DUF58 domain-containing protein [Caulifigura coniformis]QDT55210.1 hypothetical protein Pan44_32520 [Caulifigura coniformis]
MDPNPSTIGSGSRSRRSRISISGFLIVCLGVGAIVAEVSTRLMARRLGMAGHVVTLGAAGYFAIWGLKELIVSAWPRFRTRRIARYRFRLPAEGRVFLVMISVLFIGSLLGRSNSLLLVFCCLIGPFVINGFLIFAMLQRLAVTRDAPLRMMAGECVAVEVQLANRKRVMPTWMMSVRDRAETVNEVIEPEVLFVHVPRGGKQVSAYQLSIASRGRVTLGPVELHSRFPLGIVDRGLQFDLPAQILVYPRIGRLTQSWRRLTETSHTSSQSARQSSHAADTFHTMREYHSGDDPRTIHWRTSARRNELMVREFRDQRDTPVVLLLDGWRAPGGAERDERMELAISFAATVCVQQLHASRDAPVALAAAGKSWLEWNEISQRQPIEDLLDGLAVLETSANADWRRLVEFSMRIADRRHTTLLLTPRPEVIERELGELQATHGWDRNPVGMIRVMSLSEIENSRAFAWA